MSISYSSSSRSVSSVLLVGFGLYDVLRRVSMAGCRRLLKRQIQVNVMQKSVVYGKWPNVDIYCKRADAIKQSY